jgi:hypothetical protein
MCENRSRRAMTGFHTSTEPSWLSLFFQHRHIKSTRFTETEEISPLLRETGWYSMGDMTNTSEVIWLSRKDLADRLGVPNKTPAE